MQNLKRGELVCFTCGEGEFWRVEMGIVPSIVASLEQHEEAQGTVWGGAEGTKEGQV